MHSHDHSHPTGAFQRLDAPEGAEARAAFAAAARAAPEPAMGHGDSGMDAEHMAALELAARADATHVAVAHGNWFDPATWAEGGVPGAGARVLIPEGIEVTYDGASDAALFTVRVDGHLTFATEGTLGMRLDTMVTGPSGHLTIGTAETPVTGDIRIDFVNSGEIDTGWDPMLLSRGLVALGTTVIHGETTEAHAKVAAAPMAGDSSIRLDALPEGWGPGDTIVIAGTRFEGHKWDNDIRGSRWHETEDEVRIITAVEETAEDVVLHFAEALVHDHDAPRADLATSVANLSRSITFATEDAETAAVHERAHVMFMHSDAVDVRYAAFDDLGRTDKSERSMPVGSLETVEADANVQGRYSVHLHRTGTHDAETPAMLVGNAVSGSPGWGYVHHDSHAVLHGNASFDTFGAGYVAETGNETGAWTGNIAIGAEGLRQGIKDGDNVRAFDLGRTGDGFWFQGRMVESADNIAASVNHGFVYMHRGSGMLGFDAADHDFPELFPGQTVGPDDAPILEFRGNEAFAAKQGLHVVKANPNQGHDVHSHFVDFTAWEVKSGAHFEYTSHYTMEQFDLTGREATQFNRATTGISFGNNTSDMAVVGGTIAGFATAAIDLRKNWAGDADGNDPAKHAYHVVGVAFGEGQERFANLDPALDTVLETLPEPVTPRLILDRPLTYKEGWPDPDARKVVVEGRKIDGLGETPFPAGTDSVVFSRDEVVHILETEGWWTTPEGARVFVVEILYSDRLTGEIVKEGHLVEIDDNVPLGNVHFSYADAVHRGEIDPETAAPVTQDDSAETRAGMDVVVDVLANDHDPDGPAPLLDGLVQPQHGEVFAQADGTVLYRPDPGFVGTDSFHYWASDGLSFTRGTATVAVEPVGVAPIQDGPGWDDEPGETPTLPPGEDHGDHGGGGTPPDDGGQDGDGGAGPVPPVPENPDTPPPPSDLRPLIEGGAGRDRLQGSAADERLVGHGGRDILYGGGGTDAMTGGAGVDAFVLRPDPSGGTVTITDWHDGGAGRDWLAIDDQLLGFGAAGVDIRAVEAPSALAALRSGLVSYDRATGTLSVDHDRAAGPEAPIAVAILEGGAGLTLADVLLF